LRKRNWKKYLIEFASIFFAVVAAFTLNNWNDYRKKGIAEEKILFEIMKGLEKDIVDLRGNMQGHKNGIEACQYWRNLLQKKSVNQDSLQSKYIRLTRDFTSLQNTSGYQTLKSRGLELIKNDSLRSDLISIYEYDYSSLRKLEEEYEEMQFQKNYFKEINDRIAPNFIYDDKGQIIKIDSPIDLNEKDRRILLSYLVKIEFNRNYLLRYYRETENRVEELKTKIDKELKNR